MVSVRKNFGKMAIQEFTFEGVNSAVTEPFESITGMHCRLGSKEW